MQVGLREEHVIAYDWVITSLLFQQKEDFKDQVLYHNQRGESNCYVFVVIKIIKNNVSFYFWVMETELKGFTDAVLCSSAPPVIYFSTKKAMLFFIN